MTAAQLADALDVAGCRPAVEGSDLVFDCDPLAELLPALGLLHTGVRAVLTGRLWHGDRRDGGGPCGPFPARSHGPLAHGALDPEQLLPPAVGLLCVAGDSCWDRVPPSAQQDFPDLFAVHPSNHPGRPHFVVPAGVDLAR